MNWILLACATLAACELLRVLPFGTRLGEVTRHARRAAHVVSSRQISDHWKEQMLPAYALRIGLACLWLLAMLVAIVIPYLVVSPLYRGGFSGLVADMLNPWVIVALIAGSVGYLKLRGGRRDGGEAYTPSEKLLHRVALGTPVLPEMIHDVERARFLKSSPAAREGAHVFVCALARAGTTVLTRELYRSGAFGSLTYRDMPFVLAPNLWGTLSRKSRLAAQERAHGDGLSVDLDSPEALDEIYWRVMCGGDYIRADALVPHSPDADDLTGYGDLIRLVLRHTGKDRYLSKNNNNILRIPALARHFPHARFLVPVRDPLQHANSLLRQHRRFADIGRFERSYFSWLAHHEFGATHRPFQFENDFGSDPQLVDYWIENWISAYSHLVRVKAEAGDAVRFVPFERLCRDAAYRAALWGELEVPPVAGSELRPVSERAVDGAAPDLTARARDLHATLV